MKLEPRHKYLLALLVINLLAWSPLLFTDGVILNRDFHFPIYRENFIEYHTSTWNSYASQANIEQIPRLFMRAPFLGLAAMGVEVPTILKLIIVATFVFVSLSAFLFLEQLFKSMGYKEHGFCALIGALLFAYNPASLQFIGGISLLFSLGALPLTMYFAMRYSQSRDARFIVLTGLSVLLSAGHPFILVMNSALLFAFALVALPWRQALRFYVPAMALGVALLAFFILPYLSAGMVSSTDLGRQNNLDFRVFSSISDNQFYKIVTLERDRFLYVNTFPESPVHNAFHFFALALALILVFGLLMRRDILKGPHAHMVYFAAAGYIVMTLISFGARSFVGVPYHRFITSAPLGWVFRSPLKFQLYQAFFLMILFALSVLLLLRIIDGSARRTVVRLGAVLIVVGISAYGVIDANMETFNPIELPSQFYRINSILKEEGQGYKVLWYPRYWEQTTEWSQGHRVSPFDMKSSRIPTYSTSLSYTWISDGLYINPYRANAFQDEEFYRNLSRIGVRYIAFHDDRNLTYDTTRMLAIANNTVTRYQGEEWYLFEIDAKPVPAVSVATSGEPQTYEFSKLSATKWRVRIDATQPLNITLTETYDPLWEARVYSGGAEVERADAFMQYGLVNGFPVNSTGELEVMLLYRPQRWLHIGIWITLAIIAACTAYLIYKTRKERHKERLRKEWELPAFD